MSLRLCMAVILSLVPEPSSYAYLYVPEPPPLAHGSGPFGRAIEATPESGESPYGSNAPAN